MAAGSKPFAFKMALVKVALSALALGLLPVAVHAQPAPGKADVKTDSRAEDERGPGRFFRKLREDWAGRSDPAATAAENSAAAATNRKSQPAGEDSRFQPRPDPPVGSRAPGGGRNVPEPERNGMPARPPFKFSNPTVPPPLADSLPRPPGAAPRSAAPGAAQREGERSPRQTASPGRLPPAGVTGQPPPAAADRGFAPPSGPRKAEPKPSLEAGFGMELADREEGLVISVIAPEGNADQAKLRKGDRITRIGGVEVEQKQQFEEIAQMLQSGDQIELVIARRGKEDQVTLQFGQAPTATDDSTNDTRSEPVWEGGAGNQVELDLEDSREIPDFAPPASGSSRYEPGVSDSTDAIRGMGSRSENGFRRPALPGEQPERSAQPSSAELYGIIRQQQETILQLQAQVQQLRLDQQRQLQTKSSLNSGKTRGKR